MNSKDIACLKQSAKCRKADETRYNKTRQGRFERSIKTGLVHSDGRSMEISDGGRAVNRMIRSLDWAYHQARRERCIREQAARLKDSTLQRILWGVFRGRNQAEAIRIAGVSRATFFRGVAKIMKIASCPIKTGKRGKGGRRGVRQKVRKSRF